MTLLQLKYFQVACKHKNITRAMEELHISQPSITSAIKNLEKEFDTILLVRGKTGFSLTEAGEELLKLAEKLLDRKRLDFEILTAVDMVIYSIDFAQAESYRERMLKNGNISKSVVVEWKLKQDYKWDNFIKDWTDFTGKSTDFTAFGGIMLDTYGKFYQIWRAEVNGEK